MKFYIRHDIRGRLRFHVNMSRMSFAQADTLLYFLNTLDYVTEAKVYERKADASVCYSGDRSRLIEDLKSFDFNEIEVPKAVYESSGRKLNAEYTDKLANQVLVHFGKKLLLPYKIRAGLTVLKALGFMKKGIESLAKRKLEVSVLDATAIAAAIVRGDIETAGSVMFLLNIGETMEEWTHKRSVNDLAHSMSLNVNKVWLKSPDGQEVLTKTNQIKKGDLVLVHMGNVIPFDGCVTDGEGMVNQSSMTGEGLPVHKTKESSVYAGTVLEEGELVIEVRQTSGTTRYEKIVAMIEETEKLKSARESRAEHLSDRLVPYTLGGTILTWILTRNAAKTMSVLMVDFSCALKLAMPITVLSAIQEAGKHHITVKGGKYLEAVSEATTIVFDKTGTLTRAKPTVREVISFCEKGERDLLRIAACLEEHFPHSIARAVVGAAKKRGIIHEEMHTKVHYIVAHGIATEIDGDRAIIGSYHFVFEDEKCTVDPEYEHLLQTLPLDCSHLYLGINQKLSAVICIEDPLRSESRDAVRNLKDAGFTKIVMMTGDSERTAKNVAEQVGVDEYFSEVLPEDKASFIEKEKQKGKKVLMVGDGINDSPALSAANVGIAVSNGAEIAREIADITISTDNLEELVFLKRLSNAMVRRIDTNYRKIITVNGALIALGVSGIIMPAASATIHNLSTLAISLSAMKKYINE